MKKSKIIITFTLIITSLFLSGCDIFTGSKSNVLIFRDIDSNTCEVIGYEEPISKKNSNLYLNFLQKEQGVGIVIPSKYENKKVVSIGEGAFANCTSLTSIKIPSTVTDIGNGAFAECNSLESITLPFVGNTLNGEKNTHFAYIFGASTNYYYDAEYYVPTSLKEVIITGGTSIGSSAFYNCSSLESIVIPNSVTSIGGTAFRECSSLESIKIPDSVTSIGPYAFYNCSSLESIVIPDSVTSIGGAAFRECSSLESIVIPNSITSIGKSAFRGCNSLESITIPDGVTSIGDYAFEYCRSLESIVIPNSVTSIGLYAFYNCSSLESITLPFIGNTLDGTTNTHFGYIFGASSYYDNISCVPTSLKEVIITGGSSIGEYAFYNCSSLESIVIPDGVTSIGYVAFDYCRSLENVYYNGTLEDWCNFEFRNSSSNPMSYAKHFYMKDSNNEYYEVTEIEIPDTVTTIGDHQFYGFNYIKKVIIPASVTIIGVNAFSECSSLTIYCEITSEPSGWSSYWNYSNRPVYWGYKK